MEAGEYIKATVYVAEDYVGEITIPVIASDIGNKKKIAAMNEPELRNAIEEHVEDYVAANSGCVVDPDGVFSLCAQIVVSENSTVDTSTKVQYLEKLMTTLHETRNIMGDGTYEEGMLDSMLNTIENRVSVLEQ